MGCRRCACDAEACLRARRIHHLNLTPSGGEKAVSVDYGRSVSLRQLKWLTIVAPLAFLAVLDFTRRLVAPERLPGWIGDVLVAAIVLAAVLVFSDTIFGRIERMQASLERQNRELPARSACPRPTRLCGRCWRCRSSRPDA